MIGVRGANNSALRGFPATNRGMRPHSSGLRGAQHISPADELSGSLVCYLTRDLAVAAFEYL